MKVKCNECSAVIEAKLLAYHIKYLHKQSPCLLYCCAFATQYQNPDPVNSLEITDKGTHDSMTDMELPNFENDIIPHIESQPIAKCALDIAAKFYSNLTMTRSQSNSVIKTFDSFLNSSIINTDK